MLAWAFESKAEDGGAWATGRDARGARVVSRKAEWMDMVEMVEAGREVIGDLGSWAASKGVLRRVLAAAALVIVISGMRPTAGAASGPVTVCTGSGCDYESIAAAVAGVGVGGRIDVLDAVHTESDIVVDKDVTIAGLGASDTIVQAHSLPGDAAGRVFEVADGVELTICDLTVRHGRVAGSSAHGGGILNHGVLTLRRVALMANEAVGEYAYSGGTARGGGLYSDGSLLIVDSTVSTNLAEGGEGYSKGGAGEGGGLFAKEGTIRLVNVTVSGNVASGGDACGP